MTNQPGSHPRTAAKISHRPLSSWLDRRKKQITYLVIYLRYGALLCAAAAKKREGGRNRPTDPTRNRGWWLQPSKQAKKAKDSRLDCCSCLWPERERRQASKARYTTAA